MTRKMILTRSLTAALALALLCSCADHGSKRQPSGAAALRANHHLFGAWQSLAKLPAGYNYYLQLLPNGSFSAVWHFRHGGASYYHPAEGSFSHQPATGNITFRYSESNPCSAEHYSLEDGKTISYRFAHGELTLIYHEFPDRELLPGERQDDKVAFRRLAAFPPQSSALRCHEAAVLAN